MELRISPHHKNSFPIEGLLIKHASVEHWLIEIQRMNLALEHIQIYPIPSVTANSIWGCLVLYSGKLDVHILGKNELCQRVSSNFFIPEKTTFYPALAEKEIEAKFVSAKHLFHPDFGMVELAEDFDITSCIELPQQNHVNVTIPEQRVFIPGSIHAFQVKSLSEEEVLKNLEENIFPKKKSLKEEPLTVFEKVKLGLYKLLFSKGDIIPMNTVNTVSENQKVEKLSTGLFSKLESWMQSISNNRWTKKLHQDFEDLEKRNQKQIDKLMDLFKNNPEEALKYAIPLDGEGTARGGDQSSFDLTKRWLNFSWMQQNARNSPNSGGSIDLGDHYYELQRQYYKAAEDMLNKKDYQKAAFIYLKLLKSYTSAAQALESGKYYQEAATIYVKHANNKLKAAECYENGKMIDEAIHLYKELNENEKVGDLYVTINKHKDAKLYYEKVVEDFKLRNQYVKASLVYRNKIKNAAEAQSLLLDGWRSNRDASNCLNNYFSNITDIKTLKNEIHRVYNSDVTEQNSETFLTVIQHEYKKGNELEEPTRELAYEIVAKNIKANPSIVSLLRGFNKDDKQLLKDTMRYKQQNKS
jgi:tetratricopeptide (TPR) repeat protein